ncbi:MAG: prolyl oligopeptidase family serine peptidase [Candidatus Aminicenantales bacterium]
MKVRSLAVLLVIVLAGIPSFGQEPYKRPPQEVIDILDAPPTPLISMSPAGDIMALIERQSMPSIAQVSQPILRLAGIRITPATSSRQTLMFNTGISLKNLKTGAIQKIDFPDGMKFTFPAWAPDGGAMALLRYLDEGVELWVVDVKTGAVKALTPAVINAVTTSFGWLPDSRRLYVSLVPEDRGPVPEPPRVPIGPNIQETAGQFTKAATYQDLLKTAFDEALFDHYATAQLALVDIAGGPPRKIGRPGIFADVSSSPDLRYILVNRLKRPYSYSVPLYGFARAYEVWDMEGNLVHLLADLPPAENVPINGVPTGPRDVDWMTHKSSTLIWVEALDGGDPEKEVPFRDQYMTLPAPFKESSRSVLRLKERASGLGYFRRSGLTYFATPGLALASEYTWKKRWRTTYLVDLDRPEVIPKKWFDLSTQDRYNDPGTPVMTTLRNGQSVILQDKDWIYLDGSGSSPQGDHPFLDRMNIKTMKKERLFHCQDAAYETFVDFFMDSRSKIITSFETQTDPPNYCIYDLKTKKRKALTEFADPAPQLTGIKKKRIQYKRDDGVDLSGTLYLPLDRKPDERLPVVVWAYPIEYTDPSTAGQVRGSVNRFTYYRGSSHLFFITQGYAILDGAEMPIIGDPKTVNDTFVKQLVANAAAAIKTLDEFGVGDPHRVGIGGHSYGAFMTANVLAHCDLFAAGIARSGAYNRTLTPFGFQSERRTLWEATETYVKMSPFMHAEKINEPILLIHGEADNNSGTFPIQSERLYAALKGFGTTTRLVMLPNESHGYIARESILHVLAEMFEWFDKYVKNRK